MGTHTHTYNNFIYYLPSHHHRLNLRRVKSVHTDIRIHTQHQALVLMLWIRSYVGLARCSVCVRYIDRNAINYWWDERVWRIEGKKRCRRRSINIGSRASEKRRRERKRWWWGEVFNEGSGGGREKRYGGTKERRTKGNKPTVAEEAGKEDLILRRKGKKSRRGEEWKKGS